jgi:hypothetical protein
MGKGRRQALDTERFGVIPPTHVITRSSKIIIKGVGMGKGRRQALDTQRFGVIPPTHVITRSSKIIIKGGSLLPQFTHLSIISSCSFSPDPL